MSTPIRSKEPLMGSSQRPRFAICSPGLKLNQADESNLRQNLHTSGLFEAPYPDENDDFILNIISTNHLGDRHSRQVLRRTRRADQQAFIAASGCYPQLFIDDDGRLLRSRLTRNNDITCTPELSHLQPNQIVDVRLADSIRDGVRAALAGPVK